MRRSDREITDLSKILSVIKDCNVICLVILRKKKADAWLIAMRRLVSI